MPASAMMRSHIVDHPPRRFIRFDGHAGFRRVDRARDARQFFAARAFANIGRAEIERLAGDVNLDGIQIFSAEHFHARDDAILRGKAFLHQRDVVDAEVQLRWRRWPPSNRARRGKFLDARSTAADVRLQNQRIADLFGRTQRLRRVIDHARLGIRQVPAAPSATAAAPSKFPW